MKHNQFNKDFKFIKEPENFNKYTNKNLLKYCLGATLYMPGKKDIANKIINKEISNLTTMVMCFEDAIRREDLKEAEDNVIHILNVFNENIENKNITIDDLPLYFLRVRNIEQFKSFISRLNEKHFKLLTGFIFPKFNSSNGYEYLNILESINKKYKEIVYGMPILETPEIIYKESRLSELIKIQKILNKYDNLILNIRVGATDFSALFGVRRGIDYTIYDINVINDCLSDIINFFGRSNKDYVLSAPVWEYFSQENRILKPQIRKTPFNINKMVRHRTEVINAATDGLIREVILDKANGFTGKTIIHPSHVNFVNALQCVTQEEYEDALLIVNNQGGGVLKGYNGNKMNETQPHLSWALKILLKARAYGVIENNSYVMLF